MLENLGCPCFSGMIQSFYETARMNLQMKLGENQRALDPRCKCDMSRERCKAIATPVFINIEWKIKAFLNPNLYKLKKCRSKNSTNNGAECIGKSDPNVDLDSLWRRES
jgi:hypothetical protein